MAWKRTETLRNSFLLATLLLIACGDVVIHDPDVFMPPPSPHEYCGDGICQIWDGEDGTWCEDCPLVVEEPYCGDGVCQGWEDYLSCKQDCDATNAWHNGTPWEPGFSDPVDPPWQRP